MTDPLSNGAEGSGVVRLSLDDIRSQTWRKLERLWSQRLQELRARNDMPQPEGSTALLRGQIAEINANLALAEDVLRRDQDPIEPGDISANY